MAIKASASSTSNYTPVPAGNHIGRVYSVMHLGVQKSEWQGQERDRDMVRIVFEIPGETKVFKEGEDAKPLTIAGEYTLSMAEKAKLRPIVEGIIGTKLMEHEAVNFDVLDVLGRACMVNVVHEEGRNGTTYANIANTAPLPKGIEAPAQVNPSYKFDFEENYSEEKLEKLPQFLQDKIKASKNYRMKKGIEEPEEVIDASSVPF